MPLVYKIDVLAELKDRGYNTTRIRAEKLLSQSTLTNIRCGLGISWDSLETLCELLNMQPNEIIEYQK